jgi:TonB family protein
MVNCPGAKEWFNVIWTHLELRIRKISTHNATPSMPRTLTACLRISLVLMFVALASGASHAQATQPATSSLARPAPASGLPAKPADILKLGIAMNGLHAAGMSPWRLKASFQTFDDSGHPKSAGTFEEFWASPTKFKRILTTAASTETEFGTNHGYYRTAAKDWPSEAEILIGETLLEPIPESTSVFGLHLKAKPISIGPVHLECVTLQSAGVFVSTGIYCFAQDGPILRLKVDSWEKVRTEYDNIVLFDGRYVARDIRVIDSNGKMSATVHISTLVPISPVSDSDFSLPVGAIPITEPVSLPPKTAASLTLLPSLPSYPLVARITGTQGDVWLDISVDRSGQVENAKVISGPLALRSASIEAVKDWKYETSLILGQPVAFHTQIKVVFALRSP